MASLKQHLNRGLKGKKKLMVKSVKAKASKSRKGPEAERHLVFGKDFPPENLSLPRRAANLGIICRLWSLEELLHNKKKMT